MELLEVRGLKKRFSHREVLKGIDLTVKRGTVTAIIGPNGAGKTTLIETILGLHQPDGGTITYWRDDWRAHVSAQLQSVPLFPNLTVTENVQMFAAFYHNRLGKEDIRAKLTPFGLEAAARKRVSQLSGGQQKRLAIALAFVNRPRLIFLDEPTGDLDPRGRHDIRALIRKVSGVENAVVFTSHDMEEVARSADQVILIASGQVRARGTPDELRSRAKGKTLEDLYLHLSEEVRA